MNRAGRILEEIQWLAANPEGLNREFNPLGNSHCVMSGRASGSRELLARTHHLRQVHGCAVVNTSPATAPGVAFEDRPAADGIYTTDRDVWVAVKTADCLPLIVVGRKGPFVAAVHAGWRGLAAGIIPEVVRVHQTLGGQASDLQVLIGAAIGHANYEVGPEVIAALATGASGCPEHTVGLGFVRGNGTRWHVDLQLIAALALVELGVPGSQITIVRSCTFADANIWNSYRRDGAGHGSNVLAAALKPV